MEAAVRAFLAEGLGTVPRVLGLGDRDPGSDTFGCFDRPYWNYRLLDVANGRCQEAGLLMALAQALPAPGNRFHAQPAMAEWARAAWRFWLARRNADGSVVEVYPNERSFCATSFSAAAFVETAMLLGGAGDWGGELAAAEITMRWLGGHSNPEVGNQMAASLLALLGYARLTGNRDAARLAARRRTRETLSCRRRNRLTTRITCKAMWAGPFQKPPPIL